MTERKIGLYVEKEQEPTMTPELEHMKGQRPTTMPIQEASTWRIILAQKQLKRIEGK